MNKLMIKRAWDQMNHWLNSSDFQVKASVFSKGIKYGTDRFLQTQYHSQYSANKLTQMPLICYFMQTAVNRGGNILFYADLLTFREGKRDSNLGRKIKIWRRLEHGTLKRDWEEQKKTPTQSNNHTNKDESVELRTLLQRTNVSHTCPGKKLLKAKVARTVSETGGLSQETEG